jgi:hypothetical protein
MRIIHYIDSIKAGNLLSDQLLRLTSAQEEYADVKTITQQGDFKKLLADFQPDIVHIHSCWQYHIASNANWTAKKHCAVVFSPHWELNERARTTEQGMRKKVKALLYQAKMVRSTEALLVSSEHEKQEILSLGWTKRIDVVRDSVLNNTLTDGEMAQQTITFYRKVLDTRYQFVMTAMEKDAIPSLLHVGLAEESVHNLLPSDQLLNLRSLNPEQWRRVLLYADDEGVREIVDSAISRLQLNAPAIDTAAIRRFPLLRPKETTSVDTDKLVGNLPMTRQRLDDYTSKEDAIFKQIATIIANTRQIERKKRLSLRLLTDLYKVIKYNDYDEDRLAEVLRHLRLYRYSCRMIQLLAEKTLLKEGFMPFPPRNDRKTKGMIRNNFEQRH